MITLLNWLAALVALLTGLAMLKDTYVRAIDLRGALGRAWRAARRGGWYTVDHAELRGAVRFLLRVALLIAIVASSGVCLVTPAVGADLYSALLRCALTAMMAMQAPCPWLRWIVVGDRRVTAGRLPGVVDRRVH